MLFQAWYWYLVPASALLCSLRLDCFRSSTCAHTACLRLRMERLGKEDTARDPMAAMLLTRLVAVHNTVTCLLSALHTSVTAQATPIPRVVMEPLHIRDMDSGELGAALLLHLAFNAQPACTLHQAI